MRGRNPQGAYRRYSCAANFPQTLKKILAAVEKEGYSALGVTFGMGGGLLQKARPKPPGRAAALVPALVRRGPRAPSTT